MCWRAVKQARGGRAILEHLGLPTARAHLAPRARAAPECLVLKLEPEVVMRRVFGTLLAIIGIQLLLSRG